MYLNRMEFIYLIWLKVLSEKYIMYLDLVFEEFLTYNKGKQNNFNTILNIQTDFNHNDIHKYILDNSK